MKYLVNVKGFKRASFINGTRTYRWWIFYVTRQAYAEGVTGIETARLEVREDVLARCGEPKLDTVYEVEYGPKDTLSDYKEYRKANAPISDKDTGADVKQRRGPS